MGPFRRYLAQLEVENVSEVKWFSSNVETICEEVACTTEFGAKDGDYKAAVNGLWCRVNVHALRRELGLPVAESATAGVEYAAKLVALFANNLSLSGKYVLNLVIYIIF